MITLIKQNYIHKSINTLENVLDIMENRPGCNYIVDMLNEVIENLNKIKHVDQNYYIQEPILAPVEEVEECPSPLDLNPEEDEIEYPEHMYGM
jgi:hypothetical protein